MICEECGLRYESLKGLHLHVVKTHCSLENYYHKFYPKIDLFSKEPIIFKNYEDYFERDFNSKDNFALWCSRESKKIVQEYVLSCFSKRCKKKNTEYIPSHLELKTLFLPSWFGLISIFGSVENAVLELNKNFKLKYDYLSSVEYSTIGPEILIDTREQFPLDFKNSHFVKLTCGDYTTKGELYSDVFIERKSLSDLTSTLSVGKDRFIREIERAKSLGYYLIVVVEDTFKNAIELNPKNTFSKMLNGKYIFFCIRDILAKHDNIQFVFSDSRKNSKRIIEKIFQMKEQVKSFDLEFLKDFNLI